MVPVSVQIVQNFFWVGTFDFSDSCIFSSPTGAGITDHGVGMEDSRKVHLGRLV